MTPLPADAQARIERALAALELAVIQVRQTPPRVIPDGDGGYSYSGGQSSTDIIRMAVLAALHAIVDVVRVATVSTTDRRQIVATYCEDLATRYAISRVRLEDALRAQLWWTHFQQTLADMPSLADQLKTSMHEVPISIEDLSIATGRSGRTAIHRRTIERHRNGTPMGPASVRCYQDTFSELLHRTITFMYPPPALRRRRTGKKPATRR